MTFSPPVREAVQDMTFNPEQTGARQPFSNPRFQSGGLTIFSAVILLSLLVLMLVYSTRVQQSEQRISANE